MSLPTSGVGVVLAGPAHGLDRNAPRGESPAPQTAHRRVFQCLQTSGHPRQMTAALLDDSCGRSELL